MRTLITGVDTQRRSCLVHEADIAVALRAGDRGDPQRCPVPDDGESTAGPPAGHGAHVDVQLPPGIVRVMVVEHLPHERPSATTATTMHSTDALDIV